MKWILELHRLKPSPRQMIGVAPAPQLHRPETIVAPRALPAENSRESDRRRRDRADAT